MASRIHFLLIGPLPHSASGKLGGARVSFDHLLQFMERHQESLTLINTRQFETGWKSYFNIPYVFSRLLYHLTEADIIFLNTSRKGTRYLAPLLALLARWSGKRFVFRPFGGDLKDYTLTYPDWWQQLFLPAILKSDLLLLQTRTLEKYFTAAGARVAYLPTNRPAAPAELIRDERPFQKRFVFLGHIKADKGVDLILAAAEVLGEAYTVHLYGPIKEERYRGLSKAIYQGVLSQEEVLPKLSQYDVLLLPTHYAGEGYPGSIIEAYSLGLPVISTRWRSIPEIIVEHQTGLLIPPRSVEALVAAMRSFSISNYSNYSRQAMALFRERFDSETVLHNTLKQIKSLVEP